MAAKLTANTVLADPKTGEPVVLLKGDEVPDWATDLVPDVTDAPSKGKPAPGADKS